VYAFGTIFYALLGSGEIQPWAVPKKTPEELHALGEDKEKDGEKDRQQEKDIKDVV